MEGPVSPAPLHQRLTLERVARTAIRFGFELLVIFIGVYAASAFSEYQQRRAMMERRHQIREALVREIEGVAGNTRRVASNLARVTAEYDSAIAAGRRPPLQPLIEPVRVESHIWNATLQSDGLDLLDVPTVYRLSGFYNGLNAAFEQLEQLRNLSETLLLPNLDRGPDEFYDPETGKLRHKYEWYLSGMRNLQVQAGRLSVVGDSLVTELKAAERRNHPAGSR